MVPSPVSPRPDPPHPRGWLNRLRVLVWSVARYARRDGHQLLHVFPCRGLLARDSCEPLDQTPRLVPLCCCLHRSGASQCNQSTIDCDHHESTDGPLCRADTARDVEVQEPSCRLRAALRPPRNWYSPQGCCCAPFVEISTEIEHAGPLRCPGGAWDFSFRKPVEVVRDDCGALPVPGFSASGAHTLPTHLLPGRRLLPRAVSGAGGVGAGRKHFPVQAHMTPDTTVRTVQHCGRLHSGGSPWHWPVIQATSWHASWHRYVPATKNGMPLWPGSMATRSAVRRSMTGIASLRPSI